MQSHEQIDFSVPPVAAQGEVYIYKLKDDVDISGYKTQELEGGVHIIGHSETGHHHVLEPEDATVMERPAQVKVPEGMDVLYAIVDKPTEVKHLRSHDTHKPVSLPPGKYQIRTQRGYSPEGWQRAID